MKPGNQRMHGANTCRFFCNDGDEETSPRFLRGFSFSYKSSKENR